MAVFAAWGLSARTGQRLAVGLLFSSVVAAEALAHQHGLGLYRIDLSAVVSKYIAETEKDLRQVFNAAEDGGVLLFFDEANALFGKRTEVKNSHDRYADINVGYLRRPMEGFHGLAILTTNLKSSRGRAFHRRPPFVMNVLFLRQPDLEDPRPRHDGRRLARRRIRQSRRRRPAR